MDEQSIFLAALEKETLEARAQWLSEACGTDHALKARIEALIERHQESSRFLEQGPAEFEATIIPDSSSQDRARVLQAGLAAAFDQDQSVVIGNAGHSVLKSLGQSIDVPRVALRESKAEGHDPIVRPRSAEMPQKDSNSRYRLDGEIARGGMGAILKGRDIDLGRDLAIKVLLDQHKDKPEVVQRFVEEAQIGGQLQHPGIAPIYELGQFSDKRPFFAMKLVKGETLSKLLADRQDPAADRGRFIGIFEQVCQTMAYAHSRGVIHRDLKPANIMVGAFGEVQVMDWGLAKVLQVGGVADEKKSKALQQGQSIIQTLRSQPGSDVVGTFGTLGSQTQMGSVMGTPAYMPPEQALGEIDNLDERADVFGLGAILCEILTGKPPYVADDGTRVFRMASRGKLDDCFTRLEACGADADLVALTKHCLELEPADRPRNAGVLAERVNEYLESVETRLREAEVERAAQAARADAEAGQAAAERKRAEAESQRAEAHAERAQAESARANEEHKRRRTSLALAASVLLLVGLGSGGWLYMERQEANRQTAEAKAQRQHAADMQALADERDEQRKVAELAQGKAEAEKIRSLNMLADMQTERGLQAGSEGQSATAALWFANAVALTPHDPDRQRANHLRAASWMNEALAPAALLKLPDGDARRFEFQPNGSLLLTVSGTTLRVWDWRNEVVLLWSEALADVTDAVWSPDGKQLAVGFGTADVRIFDPVSGDELKRFRHSERVELIEWSPDGTRLAVGNLHVQIWSIVGVPLLQSDWPHPQKVFGLGFNHSGTRLATSCDDDFARVFAVDDASLPAPIFAPVEHVRVKDFPVNCTGTRNAVFLDDHRFATVSGSSRQAILRDSATGQPVTPGWTTINLFAHLGIVVSPDGRWVAAADGHNAILLGADGQRIELKHNNFVIGISFANDGQALVTTCWDGVARRWPLQESPGGGVSVGSPDTLPQQATLAMSAFSPDGSMMAISASRQVVIWERSRSQLVSGRIDAPDYFWKPRPGFDGQFVTPGVLHESSRKTQPRGGALHVARMADGQPAGPPINLDGLLADSCLCADHRSVAAATVNGTTGSLGVFDVASGAPVIPPIALPDVPISIAARPGHREVAVLGLSGRLLVIETTDGKTRLDLSHEGWTGEHSISRVAWSPDGAMLLTVTPDSLLFVRDAQTGKLRFPILQPVLQGGPCRAIAFSADSRLLATAVCGRNMVQVWDLTTGEKVGREMPHTGDMYGLFSVAFSPDGQRILTSHKDGNARLWDWMTGEVVGTPMKHPDEVFDAQFTPDGRHVVTAVRHYPPQVWDVATRKPAVPLPQSVPAGGEAESLAVAGDRVVVTAGNQFTVLDLSLLRQEPADELPTLLTRAELATNHQQQLGELVPLEQQEWSARWEQLAAARPTLEMAAESLARALDEVADAPSQSLVIARAARSGVLERLQALRPESLPLTLALAFEWSRQGRHSDVERLHAEVLSQLREIAAKGPVEPGLMQNIAQLLTKDAPRGRWIPLEPTAMKGAADTTFTPQPNGFILAGTRNAKPVTYSIEGRPAVKRIAALRLDVAPLSLPAFDGSGHGGGNFHLAEVRVRVLRADGTETILKISRAAADYVRSIDSGTTQADGPWGVLDGSLNTHWDIWLALSRPHWLMLILDEPCDFGDNETLIVELDSGDELWPLARLEHFRLSVSEELRSGLADELIAAVRQHALPPDEQLAAACLISGEAQVAIDVLKHAPQTDSRDTLLRALLLATAQHQLGKHDAAKQIAEAGLSEGVQESWPHSLTGFLDSSLRRFTQRSLSTLNY